MIILDKTRSHVPTSLRVALVHDYLTVFGGAEKVLQAFHQMFPEAPIFVLFADERIAKQHFPQAQVRTSFLSHLPRFLRNRKKLLTPLLPLAVENFDLTNFDLVLSSSSAFAKGVIGSPEARHLSYIHTPMRFAWDWYFNYINETGSVPQNAISRTLARLMLHYLRLWDQESAHRPDMLLANSRTTQDRIQSYWGRESKVVYPPVEIGKIKSYLLSQSSPITKEDYFVTVGNLSPFKKVDLAIEACNRLQKNLLVIGDGKEMARLQRLAGKTITFLGTLPDEEVYATVSKARAFLMPQVEDFGIAAVESMALGTPVIAYKKGGATESVVEGETGIFFFEQTAQSLQEAILQFLSLSNNFLTEKMLDHAEKFSRENFEAEIRRHLNLTP